MALEKSLIFLTISLFMLQASSGYHCVSLLYEQNLPPWKDLIISHDETIGTVGCFIVSFSNLFLAEGKIIDNDLVNPQNLLKFIQENECLVPNTSLLISPTLCNKLGYQIKKIAIVSWDEAEKVIKENWEQFYVIVEFNRGVTSHFCNIVGEYKGEVMVWNTFYNQTESFMTWEESKKYMVGVKSLRLVNKENGEGGNSKETFFEKGLIKIEENSMEKLL